MLETAYLIDRIKLIKINRFENYSIDPFSLRGGDGGVCIRVNCKMDQV